MAGQFDSPYPLPRATKGFELTMSRHLNQIDKELREPVAVDVMDCQTEFSLLQIGELVDMKDQEDQEEEEEEEEEGMAQ